MIRSTPIYQDTFTEHSGFLPSHNLFVWSIGWPAVCYLLHQLAGGLTGSCCPPQAHDPIYTDLPEYIHWIFRLPTQSWFHCLEHWLTSSMLFIASIGWWELTGSCCPPQAHDPIYTDLQHYIVWMFRHPIKFPFDCSGAWLSSYQLYNLSITSQRLDGSCYPAKPHDPIYTELWWYILWMFRHPIKSSIDWLWAWFSWYMEAGWIMLPCSPSSSNLHWSTGIHCQNVWASSQVHIWLFKNSVILISDI